MKTFIRCALILGLLTVATTAIAQQDRTLAGSAGLYEIGGTLVSSVGGQAVADATVWIAPIENRRAVQTVKTSTDGKFSFRQLVAGKYALGAGANGFPRQGYNQHEAFTTAIVAGKGLDTEHLLFRLRPEGSIHGTVLDEEGEPVKNAAVRLFITGTAYGYVETRTAGAKTTDDLGHYSFPHLPEGAYYIAVSGRPWYASTAQLRPRFINGVGAGSAGTDQAGGDNNPLDKAYPLTFYDGAQRSQEATAIDLQPGQSATADVRLRAVPAVHVRLPRAQTTNSTDGSAAANFRMEMPNVRLFYSIFDDLLMPASVSMIGGREGMEITGIAPGHYMMQVIEPGEGDASGVFAEMDISGDMELPSSAAPMASVTGIAQFEGGKPPSGLTVQITNKQLSRVYDAHFDDKGVFDFREPVIPGKYEISVGNVPDWYVKSITISGAKISGRTLDLSGSRAVKVAMSLGHGLGRVDGVAVRDGKGWAGAMILLVPQDAQNSTVLFRRDQSDSDGSFTLADVVPGNYTLLALQDAWHIPWSDPKALTPYQHLGQSLQIAPHAKVQASVAVQ